MTPEASLEVEMMFALQPPGTRPGRLAASRRRARLAAAFVAVVAAAVAAWLLLVSSYR